MDEAETGSGGPAEQSASDAAAAGRKRRRGSRGGQRKRKPISAAASAGPSVDGDQAESGATIDTPELPEPLREGRASPEAAERALVRKPQIGDTRPAPPPV